MTKEDLMTRLERLEEDAGCILYLLDFVDDPTLQQEREALEDFLAELKRRMQVAKARINAL